MMFRSYIAFAAVTLCLSIITQSGDSYRILCVFPAPSISHQFVFRGLTLALNKQGHELVVVTPNPINDQNLSKYTEIDISFAYDILISVEFMDNRVNNVNWIDWMSQVADDGRFVRIVDEILKYPKLRKLYSSDSDEKFDLLIVEPMLCQGVYPLARRFDVPMIGISSLGLTLNLHYTIGNPITSADLSNWELGPKIHEQFSFGQRLRNFISIWKYLYWYRTKFVPEQTAVAKKYFGNEIPDLNDLEKNISLIFVNQQGPISYSKPNIPKVIEIGGFHVSKQIINMPKDLRKILDEATEGFIYVSLGSNIKSTMMLKKTMKAFVTAFSRLPYKVLWKFEDNLFQNKPANIHTMKWVPQQAVLAHPNLKVFIYQGGLQSTEEAVHHAVPLIGLPILGDQDMQVNKMVSLGVAKKLEITTVNENELFDAITTVASDTRYKQRMLNLRSLIDDKPHDPLENAVWWTEHVIRHRGAPHLHSSTADEPWYSRQDMDIVALISAGFVIVLVFILVTLRGNETRFSHLAFLKASFSAETHPNNVKFISAIKKM